MYSQEEIRMREEVGENEVKRHRRHEIKGRDKSVGYIIMWDKQVGR